MTRPSSIVTKHATCPNCEATVTYRDHAGIRRFQAKLKRCPECDEVFR